MLREAVTRVQTAQRELAGLTSEQKNRVLQQISLQLQDSRDRIAEAQQKDISQAEREGLSPPLLKRLVLNDEKIDTLCRGTEDLQRLADPVGRVISARELDKGLELYQITCPIGVIGMVFESRPDALVQIASLCLKSGNAVVLKGGREALQTNRVLTDCIKEASRTCGITDQWLCLLETRDEVTGMLELDDLIDLIIPRGSNSFVQYIMDHTRIPVLGHADGICHVYVDEDADIIKAISVTLDAKTQYPAVCNACETLLVHRNIVEKIFEPLAESLREAGVEIRGDETTRQHIACKPAEAEDWSTEYLDLILSVKVVDSMDEAISHIHTYGSGHTECIVTENREQAEAFLHRVDSAGVFWNCSTRFADGYRYGLGAEVGISTQKIHARGPVGLEGMVTYKWKLYGTGQVSADYSGAGAKPFTHKDLKQS